LVFAALPRLNTAALGAPAPDVVAGGSILHGLGAATFLAVFATQGFEVTPVPAGETRDAARNMPRAILLSLAIASVVYVAVQIAVVGIHPSLATVSDSPLAEAARALSPLVATIVTVGGIVSTFGFVAGNAFGTPRYAFAMAERGFLPRLLTRVHPRFETPHAAIVATTLGGVLLTVTFDARNLMGMSNLSVAVQYLATCAAVIVLRRRGRPTAFRAPGGQATPIVGVVVSLWIFTGGSMSEVLVAGAALVLGLVCAAITRRASRSTG
jgi:amino acid transporter